MYLHCNLRYAHRQDSQCFCLQNKKASVTCFKLFIYLFIYLFFFSYQISNNKVGSELVFVTAAAPSASGALKLYLECM